MAMFRHRLSGRNAQQTHAGFTIAGLDRNVIGAAPKRLPFQTIKILSQIGTKRFRQDRIALPVGGVRRRLNPADGAFPGPFAGGSQPCSHILPGAVDAKIGINRFFRLQQCPSSNLHGRKAPATIGTQGEMGSNGNAPAFGKAAIGVIEQQFIADMMVNSHQRSSSERSSRVARSLANAMRILDFTVPSGRLNSLASAL